MHVSFGDGTRDDGAFPSEEICSYQSAQIAAEGRDYVTSLDTKVVTAAQCAIVVRVARLLEEHPDWGIEQTVPAAEELIRRSRLCFIPDELEYLRAGGRVSNAVALCGKLLGIHPRIELLDGRLVATKKPRGRLARLAPRLVEEFAAQERLERDELWLVWTPGFPDELRTLVEESAQRCGFRDVIWVKAGGVITTHSGPSSFGVAGFAEAD